ncbi:hemerythrin domain-containing protein [Kineococcus rubinsiae]|uniref:hemerythrin domain-containing protein n=1 Tax=Kineococcus rubinsiae TaxID=2609562 RepID=UPI00142F82EE|nr:hemerythrin domain-containing protein [Kineococcus rubinsiae]
MGEGEETRLVAWSRELRAVHERLREALAVTRTAVAQGVEAAEPATRELLLFCHGFCAALSGHHEGEDRELFPALAQQHPHLRDTLRQLQQDHSMIAHLLAGLQSAVQRTASPAELDRHLDGLAAVVESHFRYEERQLLRVLEALDLDVDVSAALGPLSAPRRRPPGAPASRPGGRRGSSGS